jgi:chromosomal replication initiation ATPase DnaA
MSAWTKCEEAFLAECALAKIPTFQIAAALERSAAVVRVRRHKLGLPPPKGADSHLMAGRGVVSVAEIKRAVAEHFGIPLESMISKCRGREITKPRQVAMFFAREMARKSYPRIGSMFGGRDHSTVMHAVKQVARRMGDDSAFNDEVSDLRKLIGDNPTFSLVSNAELEA